MKSFITTLNIVLILIPIAFIAPWIIFIVAPFMILLFTIVGSIGLVIVLFKSRTVKQKHSVYRTKTETTQAVRPAA